MAFASYFPDFGLNKWKFNVQHAILIDNLTIFFASQYTFFSSSSSIKSMYFQLTYNSFTYWSVRAFATTQTTTVALLIISFRKTYLCTFFSLLLLLYFYFNSCMCVGVAKGIDRKKIKISPMSRENFKRVKDMKMDNIHREKVRKKLYIPKVYVCDWKTHWQTINENLKKMKILFK